ncbi:PAS domain-containing sensor histidine kinase [Hymenobacter bucti]|uniref:histidine kinase n=1 Tax=Hymenobacter bucti TaxID=1844114 RepID=A0ABW4R0I2_9BACT
MPAAPESVALFNALPTPHLLLSPAFVIEAVSDAYLHATLTQRAQLVGQYMFDAFPDNPQTPEANGGHNVRASLAQVLATGQPHQIAHQHFDVPDPDRPGQFVERYWRALNAPVLDAQGNVTHIIHAAVDVTAEVQAAQQAALLATAQHQAQARETFYQVFEQTPAAICLQRGPAHRYEYVNAAYQQFFPDRPLVGRGVAEAIPEVIDNGLLAQLDRVYQTGETFQASEVSLLLDQPSGPPAWVHVSFTYQAMREHGEIVGISTFVYDVTAQIMARRQREEEQRQLEQLFMQAPAPIVILDGPDLVFQLVNPAYQRIFPGRALAGKSLLEALPELVGTPIPALFQRVYQTGKPITVQEMPLMMARHEGRAPEEIYWTFTYQARRAADGSINGVRVFANDVTEQVRTRQQIESLNQRLAASNEKLQASNQELGESNRQLTRTNVDLDTFVYTASHDLKAPITNIESIVLALRETLAAAAPPDPLVPHLLDLLDQTVARFQFTINQLTDISRLQLAHTGPAEPVNLAAVVEHVRLDLLPAVATAGTQLTVAVPAGLVVSFSPANLRSIVYNLLSNAIKYRAPGRPAWVQVRAAQTPQAVVLTVQDNGLGMTEVQQRQLFGLFQRLHTHVEGTGVGLYITKRLVENAGGNIQVQSQPNVGTTFTVSIPV